MTWQEKNLADEAIGEVLTLVTQRLEAQYPELGPLELAHMELDAGPGNVRRVKVRMKDRPDTEMVLTVARGLRAD
jgi:hypothetical protein